MGSGVKKENEKIGRIGNNENIAMKRRREWGERKEGWKRNWKESGRDRENERK